MAGYQEQHGAAETLYNHEEIATFLKSLLNFPLFTALSMYIATFANKSFKEDYKGSCLEKDPSSFFLCRLTALKRAF